MKLRTKLIHTLQLTGEECDTLEYIMQAILHGNAISSNDSIALATDLSNKLEEMRETYVVTNRSN